MNFRIMKVAGPWVLLGLLAAGQVAAAPGQAVTAAPTAPASADLVLVNADIYTVDAGQPRAQALAVVDGKFSAVGSNEEIRALAGPGTRVVDAGGYSVTPGFVDGHTHTESGLTLISGVNLTGIVDKAEWLRIIADKVATMEKGEWLFGGAWNHLLGDGVLPSKEMLDEVAPDNPVLLFDIDQHNAWANSLALEIAGVTAATEAPPGGIIELNEEGEPSGILQDSAAYMVLKHPQVKSSVAPRDALRETLAYLNSRGITSIQDMSLGGFDQQHYLDLLAAGELNMRVWKGAFVSSPDDVAELSRSRETMNGQVGAILAAQGRAGEPVYEWGYVKMMIDGVLSTYTAILFEPYADRPETVVEPLTTPEVAIPVIRAANEQGFSTSIHVIGDKATTMALDAFEAAGTRGPWPNRMEHIELIRDEDIPRLAELGVAASMQPLHVQCCVGLYTIDRVGLERNQDLGWRWREMLEHGVELVLGSDWPTAPVDPLLQITHAQTRTTYMGGELRSWDKPGDELSFEQALYGYTQAGANMSAWKEQTGSISVGKWADFVILDHTLPNEGLRDLTGVAVQATYFSGRPIYQQ